MVKNWNWIWIRSILRLIELQYMYLQELSKFKKLGITNFWDKYLVATKGIEDPAKIKEEVPKLYKNTVDNAHSFVLNEDSEAITDAIKNEIEQGREQGGVYRDWET